MRRPVIAGNWKMNGTRSSIKSLLGTILEGGINNRPGSGDGMDVVFFSPAIFLPELQSLLAGSGLAWGGQNISEHPEGAYTGEMSASMLVDYSCTHVIVGHSERRQLYGESDQLVAVKVEAAIVAGLVPVLCVGETREERECGNTEEVVKRQLAAVVEVIGVESFSKLIVAYEPVWAIGTGLTASPEQAQGVHRVIREYIGAKHGAVAKNLQILYGGSVKAANAGDLFACPDIDGGLIGGASLIAAEFLGICRAAHQD